MFQASHPEWKLQQTSQWMNQAQRLRPHFWAYLQREGQVTEPRWLFPFVRKSLKFWNFFRSQFYRAQEKDEQTLGKTSQGFRSSSG